MKKIILALSFVLLNFGMQAQNSVTYKKLVENLHADLGSEKTYSDFQLEGKMFIALRDSADHSERLIIDFQPDNQIAYAEAIIDKKTGDIFTNTLTGDVMRRGNALSVRADRLNGQRISRPKVFNFLLVSDQNIYFLMDINSREKWIETQYLDSETQKAEISQP